MEPVHIDRSLLHVTVDHTLYPRPPNTHTMMEPLASNHLTTNYRKPERGLDFLLQNQFLEGSARAVAKFFITRKGLSKQMIGEFLGNLQRDFNQEVLE